MEKFEVTGDTKYVKTTFYSIGSPPANTGIIGNKVINGDWPKSIDEFIERKKKEIPMYDPYTGEPNPHYEELTGKKNPLIETPRMLNPNIREHKVKRRFLVYLPKEFDVKIWEVSSVEKPKIYIKIKQFFGFVFYKSFINTSINLNIRDVIGSNNKILSEYLKKQTKFDFYIEEIDPTGKIVETTKFKNCRLEGINFGDLEYSSNELNIKKLTIKYKTLEII